MVDPVCRRVAGERKYFRSNPSRDDSGDNFGLISNGVCKQNDCVCSHDRLSDWCSDLARPETECLGLFSRLPFYDCGPFLFGAGRKSLVFHLGISFSLFSTPSLSFDLFRTCVSLLSGFPFFLLV